MPPERMMKPDVVGTQWCRLLLSLECPAAEPFVGLKPATERAGRDPGFGRSFASRPAKAEPLEDLLEDGAAFLDRRTGLLARLTHGVKSGSADGLDGKRRFETLQFGALDAHGTADADDRDLAGLNHEFQLPDANAQELSTFDLCQQRRSGYRCVRCGFHGCAAIQPRQ